MVKKLNKAKGMMPNFEKKSSIIPIIKKNGQEMQKNLAQLGLTTHFFD